MSIWPRVNQDQVGHNDPNHDCSTRFNVCAINQQEIEKSTMSRKVRNTEVTFKYTFKASVLFLHHKYSEKKESSIGT